MINTILGDILEQTHGILCHQTNYDGVMGGGIAASIWNRLLTDQLKNNYVDFCRKNGKGTLGFAQFLFVRNDLIIANCFSQNGFDEPDADGSITNYEEMRECFETVYDFAKQRKLPVFIPHGMGCGIAGGDWTKVLGIIDDVFNKPDVSTTIVKLDQ